MRTFGEKLRGVRKERGWTQEYLGSLVGLQKSAVAKYENGRIQNVSTDVAERFAHAFGISVHDLLDTFERNLYALDVMVEPTPSRVYVHLYPGLSASFTVGEWEAIRAKGSIAPVVEALFAENKKEAPAETDESLSEDHRYLISKIRSLSDEEVRGLRTIVDQVLALRGK